MAGGCAARNSALTASCIDRLQIQSKLPSDPHLVRQSALARPLDHASPLQPDQRMAHGSHGAIRRHQIDGAIEGSRTHGAQYAVLLLKYIHRNDHPAPANTKAAKITRISLDDPVRSQRKLVRFPNGFTPSGQPMLVMLSVAT